MASALSDTPPQPARRQYIQIQQPRQIQLLHQFPLGLQGVLLRYKQQDTLTSFTALADFFKQAGLRLPGAGTPDFDGGHKIPLTKRQMRLNNESPPRHGGG